MPHRFCGPVHKIWDNICSTICRVCQLPSAPWIPLQKLRIHLCQILLYVLTKDIRLIAVQGMALSTCQFLHVLPHSCILQTVLQIHLPAIVAVEAVAQQQSCVMQEIAARYGVLLKDKGVALRGLFVINPEGILEQATINNLPIGRSVDEALRLLQAIQFTAEHGEVSAAS